MTGDFLFEMAWKSLAVCCGVLVLLRVARGHSPAQRARLAFAGLILTAAVPILTFVLPALEVTARPAPGPAAMPATVLAPAIFTPVTVAAVAPVVEPSFALSLGSALALLWAAGAGLLIARLLGGILTLQTWTRASRPVEGQAWQAALQVCGMPRVRLLAHDSVQSPLSWGWMEPTILVGPDLIPDRENALAIIAHEVAHMRRGDWPKLLFARVVVAAFWFNPFVWLLERAFLHEVEQAADAEALQLVQPARYAKALLEVASGRGTLVAANSIAAGLVAKRILRVLHNPDARPAARWKVAVVLGALGLAAPVAALEFVPETPHSAPVHRLSQRVVPMIMAAPVAIAATRSASVEAETPAQPTKPVMAIPDMPSLPDVGVLTSVARVMSTTAALAAQTDAETAALDAELDRAQDALNAQTQRTTELAARVSELAERKAKIAMRKARQDMERGAVDMEKGADDMLRGAQDMRDEAVRLRDPAYRQRKIAEEAARGHRVTDRELIDAIPDLEKGARDMVDGAADMRRGAQDMRKTAHEQD